MARYTQRPENALKRANGKFFPEKSENCHAADDDSETSVELSFDVRNLTTVYQILINSQ